MNQNAAVALSELGYRVFPCNPDKKPRVKAWEHTAVNSPFTTMMDWSKHPEALPGLPVGTHGLVVIDCDRRPGRPDGVQAFEALCKREAIDLQQSFAVTTPTGGVHFYFRSEMPYGNSRGSLPDGIDVRGKGGYVIAPGATLPDGRCYRLDYGSWDAIPPLPDALATLLRSKDTMAAPVSSVASPASARDVGYAARVLDAEIAPLAALRPGAGRNAALNQASFALGTLVGNGSLDPQVAVHALYEAATANGHVAKHGESQTRKTIESGLNAGMGKPRSSLTVDGPVIDVENLIRTEKAKRSAIASTHPSKRTVMVKQGSTIEAKPVTWLWDGYLPLGKLTLLAGAGGTGKSTIAFSLAGIITNAGLWPDGTRCMRSGNVLIWSSEDDPADTIKPRLMAVNANQSRYGVISGTTDENGVSCPFDAALDMSGLRDAVMSIGGVSLLIIDPIVTAVTGDMHKANDVRRSLQAIVDFAAEMNCAVLGITHFAKGTAGKNSAERVIGSQAFAALARMVLVSAKEEDSDRRVFTRAKSNNSVDTGGFSYSIEALTLDRSIVATRVLWGEALEGSSRSILAGVESEENGEDTSKLGEAKRYLIEALKHQSVGSTEIIKNAREGYGIAEKTLRRAGIELGIKPQHDPRFHGGWSWSLPLSKQLAARSTA